LQISFQENYLFWFYEWHSCTTPWSWLNKDRHMTILSTFVWSEKAMWGHSFSFFTSLSCNVHQ
jgi:hypothetical protein